MMHKMGRVDMAGVGSAGFQRSKTEVVRAVHVGVGTLEMRLREFSATDAGSLTSAQLLVRRSRSPVHCTVRCLHVSTQTFA